MTVLVWFGLAHAAETDCVTKDLAWRWLSTTAPATPSDRWVHGSKVVVEQAPGATGRVTWKPDEASKVPFRTSAAVETFKWNVTLSSTDSKPIAADVPETEVKLTMHCQRTTGAAPAPAAAAAAPKAPAAAKAPAPAAAKAPAAAAKAPAPAAPAPAAPAPKP